MISVAILSKSVHADNLGAWVLVRDERTVYDEWNPVAQIDAAGSVVQRHLWGTDLSASMQGAGGVGGLLGTWDNGATTRDGTKPGDGVARVWVCAYDGNGNVSAAIAATVAGSGGRGSGGGAGTVRVARYDYDAFGKTLATWGDGAVAEANRYRFSTKPEDGTGLLYYGYRYLDTRLGRWVSRDPIGEDGGINILIFLENQTSGAVDVLGLWTKVKREGKPWATTCAENGDTWQSLAQYLKLNSSEADIWVKNHTQDPIPGRTYYVPNTVVAFTTKSALTDNWFGLALPDILRADVKNWAKDQKKEGFKVIEVYQSNSSKEFMKLWKTKGLYKYGFAGHGLIPNWWEKPFLDEEDQDFNAGYEVGEGVGPTDVALAYKISYLLALTCGASSENIRGSHLSGAGPWWMHVSESGWFRGCDGKVSFLFYSESHVQPGPSHPNVNPTRP